MPASRGSAFISASVTGRGIGSLGPTITALTGAFINLLNPKAYVFFMVIAPQFMGGHMLSLRNAFLLASISTGIATLIHLGIVAAGAGAHRLLGDKARMRTVRRLFALVMLAVAASFLLADLG